MLCLKIQLEYNFELSVTKIASFVSINKNEKKTYIKKSS